MQSPIETILSKLRNKTILVLGYGREGKSTLRFLQQWLPENKVLIADLNTPDSQTSPELSGLQVFSGANYLESCRLADVIIKSPGIPGRLIQLSANQTLSSQTDLFLEAYRSQTIGITGTKGKSTTTSLIHHLLTASGIHSILTGNIGIPCFDILADIRPDSKVVFELSANQLEFSTHSPSIGVLLNVFEEHLDHFLTLEAYRKAKLNLVLNSIKDDQIIIHHTLLPFVASSQATIQTIPNKQFDAAFDLKLKGEHNQLNAQAALLAAMAAGAEYPDLLSALSTFSGLPHRLEYLGKHGGLHFYNDSISTIPEAAVAALKTLPDTNYLILGGFDRGIHYDLLVNFLLANPVKQVFLTGEAGKRIGRMLESAGHKGIVISYFDDLHEVFQQLKAIGKSGELCLLSPAAASYDRYKNFEHRGDVFRTLAWNFS